MNVVAAVLTAAAVVLVLPVPRSGPTRATGPPRRPVSPGPGLQLGFAGVAVIVLVTVVDGITLVLALVVLAAAGATAQMMRRSRDAKAADARRSRVVEMCEVLVGELRAGQPVSVSLGRCLDLWPELEPVVAAGRLGADVPGALRRLATAPGAEGLREVASAWQVSQTSGAGLATVLSQVALTARARQGTRRLVRGELASARATARLVALMPAASLAMSAGIGGRPWHFLLATPLGVGCLGVGAAVAFAGLLWIDRIASAVLRE